MGEGGLYLKGGVRRCGNACNFPFVVPVTSYK